MMRSSVSHVLGAKISLAWNPINDGYRLVKLLIEYILFVFIVNILLTFISFLVSYVKTSFIIFCLCFTNVSINNLFNTFMILYN